MALTLLLCCLASAALLTAQATADPGTPGCGDGWTQFNSRCFKLYKEAKSWMDGEKSCHGVGANLASIHSKEENEFVVTLIIKDTGGYAMTWLGGTDAVEDKKWLWSDGTPWDYENWYSGQPDNHKEVEHSLSINHGAKTWADDNKANCWYFMCSKDVPPTPPKLMPVSLTLEGFVCKCIPEK
ncbi:unnamed protein product [Knipowitschia caucasica]